MKKLVCVCFVFFVALSGCSAGSPPSPKLDFTAEITVSSTEVASVYLKGTLVSSSQGTLSLCVTTPDEMSGLSYKWREKLKITLQDISLEVEKGYLPSSSIPEAIYNVLFNLRGMGKLQEFDGNSAVFGGECESGRYQAVTDNNGYLKNISFKELNLEIEFEYMQ